MERTVTLVNGKLASATQVMILDMELSQFAKQFWPENLSQPCTINVEYPDARFCKLKPIKTIRELCKVSREDFKKYRCIGGHTAMIFEDLLEEFGLGFNSRIDIILEERYDILEKEAKRRTKRYLKKLEAQICRDEMLKLLSEEAG